MTKHLYLGVQNGRACILKSLADFETLSANVSAIESTDFTHDATNWGGCDAVERTCRIEGVSPTGRTIDLIHPLTFYGTDYDMGHEQRWVFMVDTIFEVR